MDNVNVHICDVFRVTINPREQINTQDGRRHMSMNNKFEEFYFENDRNHPADDYWNLYDKNHQEAISKYEGHMFCPLCRLAPLTVAKGEQRRYFKVAPLDMEKHDSECSYRKKKGSKRDTEKFYKDLDRTDIRNRLISCMNRMLKKWINPTGVNTKNKVGVREHNKRFLEFTTENMEIKYLPHKNLNSKTLEDDIDVQKIYYGRCALYIFKYIPDGELEIKMYYLKVLNKDTKKQICDIAISRHIYEYLKADLDMIPEEKSKAENYYLCFCGIMEKGKYSYKCKLVDSRMLVLEKELLHL